MQKGIKFMTIAKQEQDLLTSLLNSLDRLFDRENQVVDVYDLLIASSVALTETSHSPHLLDAVDRTHIVLRSRKDPETKRDNVLNEMQTLREYLSDFLYRDFPLRI